MPIRTFVPDRHWHHTPDTTSFPAASSTPRAGLSTAPPHPPPIAESRETTDPGSANSASPTATRETLLAVHSRNLLHGLPTPASSWKPHRFPDSRAA